MAIGYATVNLGSHAVKRERSLSPLQIVLKLEAWLERRRTARILYGLDDRALADIGLSRADVEELNTSSWQDHLPLPFSR
ncbi:DUF1127 domain-containing protein [Microvirga roseola]|uniref:DUF1127 domain-containing protein n=1 Tax=Microvirga roseola TaxID=2883126 RepID=UPI001E3F3A8C|nr:DUF1127 domain-containing protein [Microvirga roseola]